jgi:putative ABC transport system permease protein
VRRVSAAQPDLLDVDRASVDALSITQTIEDVLLVLTAVMIAIGVAGVFNTLLLNSRERIRDTATLKAIAIPAGIGLDRIFFNILGSTAGGNDIPPAVYQVFAAWELVAIALTGVAVAVAAALIPGRWAAHTNVVAALHAE